MSQHVTVNDYDPEWRKKFKDEALLIKDIIADNCVAVYHIGSTSVPGLAAKPIIDIMVVVRSLEKADAAAERFSRAGSRRICQNQKKPCAEISVRHKRILRRERQLCPRGGTARAFSVRPDVGQIVYRRKEGSVQKEYFTFGRGRSCFSRTAYV